MCGYQDVWSKYQMNLRTTYESYLKSDFCCLGCHKKIIWTKKLDLGHFCLQCECLQRVPKLEKVFSHKWGRKCEDSCRLWFIFFSLFFLFCSGTQTRLHSFYCADENSVWLLCQCGWHKTAHCSTNRSPAKSRGVIRNAVYYSCTHLQHLHKYTFSGEHTGKAVQPWEAWQGAWFKIALRLNLTFTLGVTASSKNTYCRIKSSFGPLYAHSLNRVYIDNMAVETLRDKECFCPSQANLK